jgi:ABC-type multidrug transport system ATPase subunit
MLFSPCTAYRLRGVPEHYIPGMVTHLIQRVGLVKYAHVACGTLSGGNKRKLALAAALVGGGHIHV